MSAKSHDFRKVLERLSHRHQSHRVFEAFLILSACALSAQTREKECLAEAGRWQRADLDVFAEALALLVAEMEARPFEDLLGGHYLESALSEKGRQLNGEFHTPKNVCDLMAQMLLDNKAWPQEGPTTVCEPACGAGAMILSLAQACPPEVRRRLRVTAIDINPSACHMTFINTTLWGVSTRVIHGNALSSEFWFAWSNIHYIAPWLPLALRPKTEEAFAQGKPPQAEEVECIEAALKQQELSFA